MRPFILLLCVGALGCPGTLVSVRMDSPSHARVMIPEGATTPEVRMITPFRRQFEAVGMWTSRGYPMVFQLDDEAARHYGATGPVSIYARLSVREPTEFSRGQVIRLTPSDSQLRSLLQGEVSEITSFVTDPNESGNPRLVEIVMRMSSF